MVPNDPIVKKQKINISALLVIVFVQVLSLLLFHALFTAFNNQAGAFNNVKLMLLALVGVVYIGIDMFFLYTKIILLRKLLYISPIKCRIEDIIYFSHRENGRIRYTPYPIIRSEENNRLFFTYDSYSLMRFNTKSSYVNNQMTECTICKKGGIPVQIGDNADMYLLKTLNMPISIDAKKNTVTWKNKEIKFDHKNDRLDISIFNKITFFQGVIDLEADEK